MSPIKLQYIKKKTEYILNGVNIESAVERLKHNYSSLGVKNAHTLRSVANEECKIEKKVQY